MAIRALIISIAWLVMALPAAADLVSPYGGETAPNVVEISLLVDRVRVALEIDPADYPYFVGPDNGTDRPLSQRTGKTMLITAEDRALVPEIRLVDLRPRKARVTAATNMVPPRPRSAQVVYAELDYPFVGKPMSFSFTPPLDKDGMPSASIGILVKHSGVPVTDYRYLSRQETLIPDWDDPWFSAFENPNLTRHHKSPLMSFLSMEPREVRHEIIVRLRDLEGWTDLGLGAAGSLGIAEMIKVAPLAAAFMGAHNPVVIDGEGVVPADIRVFRIAVGAEGLRVLDDAEEADRATALLGFVLSYPRPALARDVKMTWDLFPKGMETVPVTLTDPAGALPAQLRAGDPVVHWTNYLTDWQEPHSKPVTVSTARIASLPLLALGLGFAASGAAWSAFRNRGSYRIASAAGAAVALCAAVFFAPMTTRIPLPGHSEPSAEAARLLISGLLENADTAMLETRPDGFATALSPFVASDRAAEVGAELRRGLSVTLPSGALARTDEIVDLKVEQVGPASEGSGSQILATWTASVSGGHWGHLHRRLITYRGLVDVSRQDDRWYLDGLTILSAQTRIAQM